MYKRTHSGRGFTLLELLVVISIIGLLASVVLAGTAAARKKGLDAQYIQERVQVRDVMELYFSYGNVYPLEPTQYYCINANNCELGPVGNVTSQLTLPGLASLSRLPEITGADGQTYRGIVYFGCANPLPNGCPAATGPTDPNAAYILTTTSQGTIMQKVGDWTLQQQTVTPPGGGAGGSGGT